MPDFAPKDRRIGELEHELAATRQQLADTQQQLADTQQQLAAARADIAELKALVEKLSKTSRNSSIPPSKDPPGTPRPTKTKSGKKRGGQPGHKGHWREYLNPDKVIPVVPDQCEGCGGRLSGQDDTPSRHQQIEVPPISPQVTDYLCHALKCWDCGHVTRGKPPVEARGTFGPRLCAIASLCTGKYRLSKRLIQELLSDLLGVELALGSVSNIEKRMSSALEQPVADAGEFLRHQGVVHADETGWRENKQKAWMWLAACNLVAVFHIAGSRGKKVIQKLLGEDFKGLTVTDRWSAYNWMAVMCRQLCWSHLIRDFQSWVDGGGAGAIYGTQLLAQTKRMFRWWHRVRDGTWTRDHFVDRMRQVQLEVATLLTAAEACEDKRVAGMAKHILKLEAALWTFVHVAGVEPTNNFAERLIRAAVLWRKGSFGTDTEKGSRFVERILTVVTTLKLQRRNSLEYLTETYRCALRGTTPPGIIPQRPALRLAA